MLNQAETNQIIRFDRSDFTLFLIRNYSSMRFGFNSHFVYLLHSDQSFLLIISFPNSGGTHRIRERLETMLTVSSSGDGNGGNLGFILKKMKQQQGPACFLKNYYI